MAGARWVAEVSAEGQAVQGRAETAQEGAAYIAKRKVSESGVCQTNVVIELIDYILTAASPRQSSGRPWRGRSGSTTSTSCTGYERRPKQRARTTKSSRKGLSEGNRR